MTTGYNKVKEFHLVFGHPICDKFNPTIWDNQKLINFRLSLLQEEIGELLDATKQHDFIECIDALSDTLYVLYGMCLCVGIDFDKLKEEFTDMPYLKNPAEFIFEDTTYESSYLQTNIKNLEQTYEMLNIACSEKSLDKVKTMIYEIYHTVYQLAIDFGLSESELDKCFDEVHCSNMTKVCISEDEAKETVEWYELRESRYQNPQYRVSADPKYWVVYDATTSKILKSINFRLPDLKKVLCRE
jgi:predicted HAD superfamily Cof-like phosphohydrolase